MWYTQKDICKKNYIKEKICEIHLPNEQVCDLAIEGLDVFFNVSVPLILTCSWAQIVMTLSVN